MEEAVSPRLVSADRFDGYIIVAFDDGRCAVYSSELLYSVLPQAQEIQESPEEQAEPEQS